MDEGLGPFVRDLTSVGGPNLSGADYRRAAHAEMSQGVSLAQNPSIEASSQNRFARMIPRPTGVGPRTCAPRPRRSRCLGMQGIPPGALSAGYRTARGVRSLGRRYGPGDRV